MRAKHPPSPLSPHPDHGTHGIEQVAWAGRWNWKCSKGSKGSTKVWSCDWPADDLC
jgi:hypothetical protein